MIKVKVDGVPREIPQCYEEMSFGLYLTILQAGMIYNLADGRVIIPIMLGITPEELKGKKIVGLESIIPALKFLEKQPLVDETPIKIGEYDLPRDVKLLEVGQLEDCYEQIVKAQALENNLPEQTKILATIAAIYTQGSIEGEEYDLKKAQDMAELFLSYPCTEVLSAGSFFQSKCLSLKSGLPMSYLRKDTLLRKNRPGLNRFLRRLDFTVLWTRLRVMWVLRTTKS